MADYYVSEMLIFSDALLTVIAHWNTCVPLFVNPLAASLIIYTLLVL
jgi:hypothetical protein